MREFGTDIHSSRAHTAVAPNVVHRVAGRLAVALVGVGLACAGSPTDNIPACAGQYGLVVGDTVPGTLQAGDRRLAGAYVDYFSLELTAESTWVAVAMTSTDLDPLLLIFAGGSTYQAFDPVGADPGMVETATWVTPDTIPLPAGCHLIGASSWATDGTGGYTLSVIRSQ